MTESTNEIQTVNLTSDEKNYLWSKLEYRKKKQSSETEDNIFKVLKSDVELTKVDVESILRSLEYKFKKKLKGLEPPIRNDFFSSITEKIPTEWLS